MKIAIILYLVMYLVILFMKKIYVPIKTIKANKINKVEYFRDELDHYSPMINAKIIGKDIFNKDVITAMILYLKEKGWDKDNNSLVSHEKEFIEKSNFIFYGLAKRKKEYVYNGTSLKRHIENLIEKDMKDLGLLNNEYLENTGYADKIDILTIIWIMINAIIPFRLLENSEVVLKALFAETIINFIWIVIYYICSSQNLILKMNLTEKGKEYFYKINASKKFLKEFTIINQKGINEQKLWGSYIRNAIFFNLRGKLNNETKKYYKDILKEFDYNDYTKVDLISILIRLTVFGPWLLLCGAMLFNEDGRILVVSLLNVLIYPFILVILIKKVNSSAAG